MLSIQNKRLGLLRLINWTQGNIQTYPWKWKTRWFDSGCWFSKVPIFRVRIWDQVAEFPAWNPTPKKVAWNLIISSFLLVNFNEKSPFKSSQNLLAHLYICFFDRDFPNGLSLSPIYCLVESPVINRNFEHCSYELAISMVIFRKNILF